MPTLTPPVEARLGPPGVADTAAREHLRGSSLLLSGRCLAIGAKFATQLLIVRHLTTADYGAWAYALSVVALLGGFSSLSMNRSVTRFMAIYHQSRQYERFFGLVILIASTVILTGLVFISGLYLFPDRLTALVGGDTQPLMVLTVLILLVPLEALDHLVISIFATFSRARAIFARRYMLGPGLRLLVVLAMVVFGAGTRFLALGYLFSAIFGLTLYAFLAIRLLQSERLLAGEHLRRVEVPVKEIVSFTVPLMTSDWLSSVLASSGVLLLGYFHGTDSVAFFKAVVPAAVLTQVVIQSFALLYTPSASRMFARDDMQGIGDFYRRTAVWIAVLSFPVFALSFFAAEPLTELMFGERYRASGTLLAILTMGYYFQAALGFNGSTLKVLGRLKYLVIINLMAVVVNLALSVAAVPALGPLGAALALSGTLVAHNIMKQIGLWMATGVNLLNSESTRCYAGVVAGVLVLAVLRPLVPETLVATVPIATAVSFAVLWITKRTLHVRDVFPEVLRVPVLRAILA